jgi:hypothetical protein
LRQVRLYIAACTGRNGCGADLLLLMLPGTTPFSLLTPGHDVFPSPLAAMQRFAHAVQVLPTFDQFP